MKLLALDISSSTGWAVLTGDIGSLPTIVDYGIIQKQKKTTEYGTYPYSFVRMTKGLAKEMFALIEKTKPDVIVIEETNGGSKSRYSQKVLEFLHAYVLAFCEGTEYEPIIKYINTRDWKIACSIALNKEEKKRNATLAKAKREARAKGAKPDLKALGIRGRFGKKHVTIRWVNQTFNTAFRPKDDDICDALALGCSLFFNVSICDGQ